VWYLIGQGNLPRGKGNSISETTKKAIGNHLTFIFPKTSRGHYILSTDSDVNEAVSQGLAGVMLSREQCKAFLVVMIQQYHHNNSRKKELSPESIMLEC